jgi:hypothetical protein
MRNGHTNISAFPEFKYASPKNIMASVDPSNINAQPIQSINTDA